MTIVPGVLVEHGVWGLGKVLNVAKPYVSVHFSSLVNSGDGPRRKLLLGAGHLSIAEVQSDPTLNRVSTGQPTARRRTAHARPSFLSLDHVIGWFGTAYPGLFADPKLKEQELDDRRTGCGIFATHFGEGRAERLLAARDEVSIAETLVKLYDITKIPSQYEKMAARDGLKDKRAAARLLRGVLAFLQQPDASSFEGLVEAVASLPGPAKGTRVLTWPNVTILPFLGDPGRFVVLKPSVAKCIAARMNWNLIYSSSPRWHTYRALLDMSAALLERLAPLGARDYVDVQSFMWVTRELE
jgi:hypothetical protein